MPREYTLVEAWECGECGMLIVCQETHNIWHNEQAIKAIKARRNRRD